MQRGHGLPHGVPLPAARLRRPEQPPRLLARLHDGQPLHGQTGGGTRYVCNPGTGYCARPFDPDELGEPCAGGFRECRGGLCLTEDASGWPAGICAYAGCRLSGTGPSATCPSGERLHR
ncbi:MAG: hypothetical protein M5U28_26950 [Sandaracinaceae bacterium]|nr:hypothetical protein [Sandaracinaceae bacterium]